MNMAIQSPTVKALQTFGGKILGNSGFQNFGAIHTIRDITPRAANVLLNASFEPSELAHEGLLSDKLNALGLIIRPATEAEVANNNINSPYQILDYQAVLPIDSFLAQDKAVLGIDFAHPETVGGLVSAYQVIAQVTNPPIKVTTNASLFLKALKLELANVKKSGQSFLNLLGLTTEEAAKMVDNKDLHMSLYHKVVQKFAQQICDLNPNIILSLEVKDEPGVTTAEDMVQEALTLISLVKNPHQIAIKVPATEAGFKAAEILSALGINVNVTLIFSLTQMEIAAKVGAAFSSPFLGREDDYYLDVMGKAVSQSDPDAYIEAELNKLPELDSFLKDPVRALWNVYKNQGKDAAVAYLINPNNSLGMLLVKEGLNLYRKLSARTMIIPASLRSEYQVLDLIKLGGIPGAPFVITTPPEKLPKAVLQAFATGQIPTQFTAVTAPELATAGVKPYYHFKTGEGQQKFYTDFQTALDEIIKTIRAEIDEPIKNQWKPKIIDWLRTHAIIHFTPGDGITTLKAGAPELVKEMEASGIDTDKYLYEIFYDLWESSKA